MPTDDEDDGSIVAILDQLRLTADLDGLAIVDLSLDSAGAPTAYCLGDPGPGGVTIGRDLLTASPGRPAHAIGPSGHTFLACPWVLPPARPGGLLLWRTPGRRSWTDEDHDLAAAVAMLLRGAIGYGAHQAAVDRLTGLPNRRWFLDEADRHIDRLDRDHLVGTLTLLDIDDLRTVNQALGRPRGDLILIRMANELRAMVRPSDVVARVGPDEFALWQDGMDHLTAAERAEALQLRRLFSDWPEIPPVTFSIGIATRHAGSTEDVRILLRRAHMAAREIKATGGGGWRVSNPETGAG